MIRWLDTVRFDKLHPAMHLAAQRIDVIYAEFFQKETWITSANDSKHMDGSKHYVGKALDFRTRNLNSAYIPQVVAAVTVALGPQFDVVPESDHLHVEFNGE